MSPPPLTPRPKREPKSSPSADVKTENSEEKKPNVDGESLDDREDRIETLKDQYKRLQALFPGVDPKHDVQAQAANAAARAQMQAKQKQAHAHAQAQAQGGGQNQAEQNLQQKQQAEIYKQHMMQQVQQQAAAIQPNQSQGPGPIR
jgi:hypothetical protein